MAVTVDPIKTHALVSRNLMGCDYDLVSECANLSQWIYETSAGQPPIPVTSAIERYDAICIDEGNYAIVRSYAHESDQDASLYVIFCGTKSIGHILSDLNANASEVHDADANIIACVHAGMHDKARNRFWPIHNQIEQCLKNQADIKNIIFTGHSLGGGVASLYVFECLKKLAFNPKGLKSANLSLYFSSEYSTKIITFGAPLVFSSKEKCDHRRSVEVFSILNRISHHFVNNMDAVPRFLGQDAWSTKAGIKLFLGQYDFAVVRAVARNVAVVRSAKAMATQLMQDISGLLQPYFGVGMFYLMKNGASPIITCGHKTIRKHLYIHDIDEENATADQLMRLLSDHGIDSYIQTMRNKSDHLKLAFNDQKMKKYDYALNASRMKQKDLEKRAGQIKKQVAGIQRTIQWHQNQIGGLGENWKSRAKVYTRALQNEVEKINRVLAAQEQAISHTEHQAQMYGKKLDELREALSKTEGALQRDMNNKVNELSERSRLDHETNRLIEIKADCETNLTECRTKLDELPKSLGNIRSAIDQKWNKKKQDLSRHFEKQFEAYRSKLDADMQQMRDDLSEKHQQLERDLEQSQQWLMMVDAAIVALGFGEIYIRSLI